MKNLILLFAAGILILSCKKETGGGHPKEVLLTEIKNDGLIENRMEYNSDNQITKIEGYNMEQTNNTAVSYVAFQYNADGQIKEYTAYGMPGNIPAQKVTVVYDSVGKLVSTSTYELGGPTPHAASFTATFYYNAKGLVSKSVSKNKEGKNTSQTNYSYYDEGHLKERQSWRAEGDVLWLSSRYTFSIPNGYHPNGMEQIRVLTGAEFIAGLHSDAINYKFYDQNGPINREYSDIMSGREYNTDGSLKQQVVTRKKVKPEGDDSSVIREYKYITQ